MPDEGNVDETREDVKDSEGLLYVETRDGKGWIVKGRKECLDWVVRIPSEIDGKPVLEIDEGAFSERKKVGFGPDAKEFHMTTGVVIPDGVRKIGEKAFDHCTYLESVRIPSSVKVIGDSAFLDCTALRELYFDAEKLLDLKEDNGVFENAGTCGEGMCVVIGKDVKRIPENLFKPRRNFSLHPPKVAMVEFESGSVCTESGLNAFGACYGIDGVYVYDAATWLGIRFHHRLSNPLHAARALYLGGEPLTDLSVPDSVTSVSEYAFYGCRTLKALTFLPGTEPLDVGINSFGDCAALRIVSLHERPLRIAAGAFAGCGKLIEVYNGSSLRIKSGDGDYGGVAGHARNVYGAGSSSRLFMTEDGFEFYDDGGKYLLVGYNGREHEITLPNGVRGQRYEMYASAFCKEPSITKATVPSGVTCLSAWAFLGCDALTEVSLPDSMTEILSSAFRDCTALTSVTIPRRIVRVSEFAFARCTALESVEFAGGVTEIADQAFFGCTSLYEINLPASVTSVGVLAFSGCTALGSISLPNGVTAVRDGVFQNCVSLADVNLPDGVSYIGNGAFEGCTSLTEIRLPGSVRQIAPRAFIGCTALTNVYFPDGLTTIECNAFSDCASLESIVIPKSVTKIGENAFLGCRNLRDIYYGGSETAWRKTTGGLSVAGRLPVFLHFNYKE